MTSIVRGGTSRGEWWACKLATLPLLINPCPGIQSVRQGNEMGASRCLSAVGFPVSWTALMLPVKGISGWARSRDWQSFGEGYCGCGRVDLGTP